MFSYARHNLVPLCSPCEAAGKRRAKRVLCVRLSVDIGFLLETLLFVGFLVKRSKINIKIMKSAVVCALPLSNVTHTLTTHENDGMHAK